MANRETQKAIMFFTIKVAVLIAGWWYFADRILAFANNRDMTSVAIYSGIFVAIVLVLMLMFRWSGFITRVLAAIIGIGALASILVKHITLGPVVNSFVGIYTGILVVSLIAIYFIVFRKIEI